MLEGQFVFTHLTENGTDVEMDIAGVRDLQAIINGLIAKVQVVVLNFQSFLKVGKSAAQFLGTTEDTCEVIVCNGTVTITFFSQTDCLMEEFKGDLEVFFLKETH